MIEGLAIKNEEKVNIVEMPLAEENKNDEEEEDMDDYFAKLES